MNGPSQKRMNPVTRPGADQHFAVRVCLSEACGLRYPVAQGDVRGQTCPRCGGATRLAVCRSLTTDTRIDWTTQAPCPVYAVLDNVRSAYNVGSMLRIADGIGVERAFLCGITPTPHNSKIAKTALGAEAAVEWSYHADALRAAAGLLEAGVALWAIENVEGSLPLTEAALPTSVAGIGLVVGNEVTGIDPELLSQCERVLHIPMQGVKGSLNVAVAFGIAAYWLRGAAGLHRENGI